MIYVDTFLVPVHVPKLSKMSQEMQIGKIQAFVC